MGQSHQQECKLTKTGFPTGSKHLVFALQPAMADWIEKMNKDLEKADTVKLSVVKERTSRVSDWLNKTL